MSQTSIPTKINLKSDYKFPLFKDCVQAGFPSPAEDIIEKKLSLDKLLIAHESSTYFVRVQGNSMQDHTNNSGIFADDLLIVDKALKPKAADVVIAYINAEFTVKTLNKIGDQYYLVASNPKYPPIPVNEDVEIWGVVTYVIHKT